MDEPKSPDLSGLVGDSNFFSTNPHNFNIYSFVNKLEFNFKRDI